MASTNLQILIKAQDQASPVIRRVSGAIDSTSDSAAANSTVMQRLSGNWGTFAAISAGAGVALYGVLGQMSRANAEAVKLQSALTGLNSVARAFGQDADAAKVAAQQLASDGLMTVGDAAIGLKNLLASGFSLDQAVTLMTRFKDSAAFGRQSALSFGQAVASATEGIKNGNSILVDNAGVTKNLSVILREAGFAETDLMRATSDANVRMALFNGILKETNPQLGDAARLADSAAGKQAQMAAQTAVLYQQLGVALQPALLSFLQTITPIITGLSQWISQNQGLAATIVIGTGVVLALIAVMGTLATAIVATRTVMMTFGPAAVASAGMARGAFVSLRALVMSPLAMPAIAVGAAIAALHQVIGAVNAVRGAINALNNAAESKAASIAAENDAIRRIQNSNQSAEWKARKINEIRSFSARAMGGPVAQGTSYLVGERGPEIFTPSTSGTITASSGGESGGHVTNFYGPIHLDSASAVDRFIERYDRSGVLVGKGLAA